MVANHALRDVGRALPGIRPSRADRMLRSLKLLSDLEQARGRHFPESAFANPAWAMLIELMKAELKGHDIPVLSLCASVPAPNSTALRWIAILTRLQLIRRCPDPSDRRRIHLKLTPAGRQRAEALLQEVERWAPIPG